MRNKAEVSPRNLYLMQERERVNASPLLAEKYPSLKSLSADLCYRDADLPDRKKEIKYTFNLSHAKSVFLINCQNTECVQGDFDLSEIAADGVAAGRTSVTGELVCQGWRSQTEMGSVRCGKILRFTLTLSY